MKHVIDLSSKKIVESVFDGTDLSRFGEGYLIVNTSLAHPATEYTYNQATGKLDHTPPPEPTPAELLAQAKQEGKRRIDAQAERVRNSALTPGAGQAMVYLQKEKEAERFGTDANPLPENYPYAVAEVGITPHPQTGQVAETWQEVIAIFAFTAGMWNQGGPAVEQARRSAKYAIDQAQSEAEIEAVIEGVVWPTLED
jgi:hypothetical protein